MPKIMKTSVLGVSHRMRNLLVITSSSFLVMKKKALLTFKSSYTDL
jgi:hypothetical protein